MNLSRSKLDEMLDVSAGLVNYIENGKYDVLRLELLSKISKVLDIPVDELKLFKELNKLYVKALEAKKVY